MVPERRWARIQRGKQQIDPLAEKLLEAINDLQSSGDQASEKLAVKVGIAAMRMNCGDRYEEAAKPIISSNSVSVISMYSNTVHAWRS